MMLTTSVGQVVLSKWDKMVFVGDDGDTMQSMGKEGDGAGVASVYG